MRDYAGSYRSRCLDKGLPDEVNVSRVGLNQKESFHSLLSLVIPYKSRPIKANATRFPSASTEKGNTHAEVRTPGTAHHSVQRCSSNVCSQRQLPEGM